MPSKANDKANNGQQGANPPPHADGGTASRPSTATTTIGGIRAEQLAIATMNASNDESANRSAAARNSTLREGSTDGDSRTSPPPPPNPPPRKKCPSTPTADGEMLGTPNALSADELPALLHSSPPEELARVLAGVAATMNAPIVEEGAGDEARRLAPGLLRNGNSELANPGRNLFSVPLNCNRNENNLAGGILGKNWPPLAPEAIVLDGVGHALPLMTQTCAPPPAAMDSADDAIFAEGGGDNESGLGIGGNKSPPSIERTRVGSSPPTNAAAALSPVPAAVDADTAPRASAAASAIPATNSSGNTPSQQRALDDFKKSPKYPIFLASLGRSHGRKNKNGSKAQPRKKEEAPTTMDTKTCRDANSEHANSGRKLLSAPSNISETENSPPLAPLPLPADNGLASISQTGAPLPAAVDIAMRPASLAGSPYSGDSLTSPVNDDAIFAEGGGDNELGHNHDRNQLLENRGVELIDDNEDLPLSNAMIESSVPDTLKSVRQQDSENGNKIKLIEDIDVDGPPRPPAMLAGSPDNVDICSKKAAKGIQFATADEELSPRPFDAAEFEDGDAIKKKRQHVPQQPMRSDEDSSSIPTNEEMNVEVELNAVDGTVEATSPPAVIGANADTANPDAQRTEDEEEDTAQVNNPESTIMDAIVDLETGSPYEVPLATWITDDVIDATRLDPIEPPLRWFKQKQAKFFFVLVGVVLAVVIVSSVLLPSNNENAVTIVVASSNAPSLSMKPSSIPSPHPTLVSSNIPSITTFPSIDPTEPPSVSAIPTTSPSNERTSVPSSPPSFCVAKMSSSVQQLDLPVNDPYYPEVAVDGRNMVVAIQDGDCGPVTVIFHSLKNDGWQRVRIFPYDDDLGSSPAVAISGKTAFVGFRDANDGAGAVLVYEQNQFGNWDEVEDPFIQDFNASYSRRFGFTVAIHRDLASVSDYDDAYIFRCKSDKWVEIDRIDLRAYDISISGDIIAIASLSSTLGRVIHLYKYMPDLDGVVSIQDPISTGWVSSMDLSKNYLVYWDPNEENAFIYRREATYQTFVFHQRLNISGPRNNYGLALDNDILVVRGDSNTHIFSEQNGNWVETITLDQGYRRYALSGRQLLARTDNHEVYSYNIQDCAQEMPTQIPSLSSKPLASPITSPSMSLYPSNTCYWITIAIVCDWFPEEPSWKLWRVADDDGEDELFKSHQRLEGDVSHSQPICLPEGEWKLVISVFFYGLEGHYNVTSNGALIAGGGEFFDEESTTFLIPFVPNPSISPSPPPSSENSSSFYPSMSQSPSLAPTASLSPTNTCYWITIAIVHDWFPEETSWKLWRVADDDGEDELFKSHQGLEGDVSHSQPICLPEGEWKFVISDSFYGLCCDWREGHYNVTSNGALIAEGGEFSTWESTTFSIPFVPGSNVEVESSTLWPTYFPTSAP